ncbi:MAG: CoB--CoM heterodisulfide reductase iron-sulfur subunit B family protein [Deltaproteobacteria bacterium]|nr:CoB--CoM heterodisulfide reductase iron-sulfur subunit B family protein [Deltaproteobacteria bacterium]
MSEKFRYSYFPGCSLMATNRAYDISTRNVAKTLGIELEEVDDWNCCGATAYMPIREKRAFVLSARNLAIASKKKDQPLATVCNACYVVLKKTNKYMAENSTLKQEIRTALLAGGMDYDGTVGVRHLLDVIVNEIGEAKVLKHVVRNLSGLRVACYSGCQLSRPFSDCDDPEYPKMMERLASWLGAEPVYFPLSAKCCGAMAMTTSRETGYALGGQILHAAKQQGAHCIVTACPLCQFNLEGYQDEISRATGKESQIPVLYFTQLLGCALGLSGQELALSESLTPVKPLLENRVGSL